MGGSLYVFYFFRCEVLAYLQVGWALQPLRHCSIHLSLVPVSQYHHRALESALLVLTLGNCHLQGGATTQVRAGQGRAGPGQGSFSSEDRGGQGRGTTQHVLHHSGSLRKQRKDKRSKARRAHLPPQRQITQSAVVISSNGFIKRQLYAGAVKAIGF